MVSSSGVVMVSRRVNEETRQRGEVRAPAGMQHGAACICPSDLSAAVAGGQWHWQNAHSLQHGQSIFSGLVDHNLLISPMDHAARSSATDPVRYFLPLRSGEQSATPRLKRSFQARGPGRGLLQAALANHYACFLGVCWQT